MQRKDFLHYSKRRSVCQAMPRSRPMAQPPCPEIELSQSAAPSSRPSARRRGKPQCYNEFRARKRSMLYREESQCKEKWTLICNFWSRKSEAWQPGSSIAGIFCTSAPFWGRNRPAKSGSSSTSRRCNSAISPPASTPNWPPSTGFSPFWSCPSCGSSS